MKYFSSERYLGNNVTPLIRNYVTNLARGTPVGGQFGWGGYAVEKISIAPKG